MVPFTTTYLEICSCVCSDISNLAPKNSPKLAQINRVSAILLLYLESFKKIVL